MEPCETEWYGVRCLFDHGQSEKVPGSRMYEERIVIVRGSSFEDAIATAERNADRYAHDLDGVDYIGCAQAYVVADELADDPRQEGAEVFSLMRSSPLGADDYVRRFFATGAEHEGELSCDSA